MVRQSYIRYTLSFLFLIFILRCPAVANSITMGTASPNLNNHLSENLQQPIPNLNFEPAEQELRRIETIYSREMEDYYARYSVEDLEMETKLSNIRLLNYLLLALSALLLLAGIAYFYLRWEQRRIKKSSDALLKAIELEKQSVYQKSLLLANMSHEIKTPLNALSGFSELLATEGKDEEIRQQCHDVITLNADLLLKLINDVVDLSCMNRGQITLEYSACQLDVLCKNVISTVERIKNTSATIELDIPSQLPTLLTDAARLQQVLINLLVNACKFTKVGKIVLKLEKQNEATWLFSVTDTGCGIPLEKQGKLFHRFEKLDEQVQGTGLGLSICQLIVRSLGGEIWVDSTYMRGARFLFTHPIQEEIQ